MAQATELMYHSRISRIVQKYCVECLREGGVAPFALDTYDELVAHAGMVKQVVERRMMPPWFTESHKNAAADEDGTLNLEELRQFLAGKGRGSLREPMPGRAFEPMGKAALDRGAIHDNQTLRSRKTR
jgi:hypothetical protein